MAAIWTGNAFGLSLMSAFPLAGLTAGAAPPGPRSLRVVLDDPPDAGPAAEPIHGSAGLAIDRDPDGYRFAAPGAGACHLSADGSRLLCRPDDSDALLWQRVLAAQVLPFAALLQGLEVFHAAAVDLGAGAVALGGASGAGKSTLALHLQRQGAAFVADDVLALELRDGTVLAHPGLGLVRQDEVVHTVPVAPEPLPVHTFCLLERDPGLSALTAEEVSGDPRALLASTFNLVVASPARLARQLELCAALAAQARMLRVRVPERPTAAAAADLAASCRSGAGRAPTAPRTEPA